MDLIIFLTKPTLNLSISSKTFAMNYIIENNISSNNFLEIAQKVNLKSKIICYHILDLIVEKNPNYLNKNTNFLKLSLTTNNESIKRCVSRIILQQFYNNVADFNKQERNLIIETMFDWLINPSLVAIRVNAIHVLFYLIDEFDWIKDQLIAIIQQNLQLKEPSFISRGNLILKKISLLKS